MSRSALVSVVAAERWTCNDATAVADVSAHVAARDAVAYGHLALVAVAAADRWTCNDATAVADVSAHVAARDPVACGHLCAGVVSAAPAGSPERMGDAHDTNPTVPRTDGDATAASSEPGSSPLEAARKFCRTR